MDERRYSSWLLERISIGETVRLRLGVSTIGRHSSSAIRIIDSQYASRHHAEIEVAADDLGVTIKDLNSINGVFVNENHFMNDTVSIVNGDLIGIGVSVNELNEEDDIQLPIYELKYAPIRRMRPAQPPAPAPRVVQDVVLTQETNKKKEKVKDNKQNDEDNIPSFSRNCNRGNESPKIPKLPVKINDENLPSCSRNSNRGDESLNTPRPPVKIDDVIVEISDDDDDEDGRKKAEKSNAENLCKENETHSSSNQKPLIDTADQLKDKVDSNITNENLIKISNESPKIDIMIKKEKIDQLDCSASSSSSSKKSIPYATDDLKPSSSSSSSKKPILDDTDDFKTSLITNTTNTTNLNQNPPLADKKESTNPDQITENLNLNQPELIKNNKQQDDDVASKEKVTDVHVPIISSIKKELIRSVSANIQNIFGDIAKDDDDVVQNKLKEINPLVYNEINGKPLIQSSNIEPALHNGDFILLTDDDEDAEEEELGTIIPITDDNQERDSSTLKSPNLFDTSLNDSKEDELVNQIKEHLKDDHNVNKTTTDNVDLDEYCNYMPHSDDEDIEESMFSQVLINDMKAELQDDLENDLDLPQPPNGDDQLMPTSLTILENIQIKQEPGLEVSILASIPKELENSCWTISDDEDDEELENKVNDWSNKIFSQSLINMSQVYDLNTADIDEDEADPESDTDGDLNDLEDDIDNIADFYNTNIDDDVNQETIVKDIFSDFDKKLKNLNNEIQTAKEKFFEKANKSLDNKEKEEDALKNENIEKDKINLTEKISKEIVDSPKSKEKSPDIPLDSLKSKEKSLDIPDKINGNDNLSQSPIVRIRRLSKNRPVIHSSSSSEDEQEPELKKDQTETAQKPELLKTNHEVIDNNTTKPMQEKPLTTTTTRLLPPVIDAPSLPKHKGKLRGVSAEPTQFTKPKPTTSCQPHNKFPGDMLLASMYATKQKLIQERYKRDLKRKWQEKPSTSKKRDREQKKIIKESRKDKLKELAEKQKTPATENNNKRKLSTECYTHQSKKPKVKVTSQNRGAFLVDNDPKKPPQPAANNKSDNNYQFKIPKVINKKPEVNKKQSSDLKRSNSVDCLETFSQQISKPDELLLKRQNSDPSKNTEQPTDNSSSIKPPLRRHSISEQPKQTPQSTPVFNNFKKPAIPPLSPTICKEAVAARAVRTTNKITFASMEKNIIESEENKRKLNKLSSDTLVSSMKTAASSSAKKTVRFNDTPVIHYIERISGARRKVVNKDLMPLTTNKDRRHMVRNMYPVIDCTDAIISNILCWSNEWLIKRNAAAEAASDVIFPMPQQFNSFEHYKSILFPLMKIEFISLLERDFQSTFNVKNFKVTLEYVTQNKDRFMLVTKFNYQNKAQQDSSLYDLVLLNSDKGVPQIFAHATGNRKGAGSTSTIVYEVIAKNFTIEYFKAIKEFNVRPVMDSVRVNFGSFNAVHQLESTPLFQKIINPLELLKSKVPPKKKIVYRGCDHLNDKQKQVLLNTYMKIIDETTPNITLLQGPPGTGKSCVITNLALQTLYGDEVRYLDKKILICAQSNAAVDVIAGKLFAISLKMRAEIRFRLIRYGKLNKMHPDVVPIALQNLIERDQLKKAQGRKKDVQGENEENLKNQILQLEAQIANLSARNIKGTVEHDGLLEKQRQLTLLRNIMNQSMRPEDERSLHSWYLGNANIICATLSSCVKLFQYVNYFDICIIDEATQCTEPWTLLPLKFGINSLVLVGDTQQLPATVLSKKASELGLGTSLFTRIQHCLDNIPCTSVKGHSSVTTPNNVICGLQTQYRMHPEICKWPNQYFYRNELINGKITIELKSPIVPFSILNLAYTQNSTCSNGKITNNLEAEFVAKLLKSLDGYIPNKYNSYGVITPYAHHRATLESAIRSLGLTNIMVNTIDSYQGLEKDVIIISNARTNGIGFLSNPQRLNVALTRPKKCLILCGNFKNLETVPAWRCLLESARERKVFHEISVNCVGDMQRNVIDKIKIKK